MYIILESGYNKNIRYEKEKNNMNKLELERINKGVLLYEKLKELPLTKKEKELFFTELALLDKDVNETKDFKITKELPGYCYNNYKRVYCRKGEGWERFLLITDGTAKTYDDVHELIKRIDNLPLEQRYVVIYWEKEEGCKLCIHEREEKVYSSHQKNMARILGIEL